MKKPIIFIGKINLGQEDKIKLTSDERDGLISFLYKASRIGDARGAMVASEYVKRGIGEEYLATTLHQILGEDCHIEEYRRIFPAVWAYREAVSQKLQRPHDSWKCAYLIAQAKKWYMDEMPMAKFSGEESRELSRLCYEKLPKIKLPFWVWDSHTKLGRKLIESKKADLILDGRWEYGQMLRLVWLKFYHKHKAKRPEVIRKLWVESFYSS